MEILKLLEMETLLPYLGSLSIAAIGLRQTAVSREHRAGHFIPEHDFELLQQHLELL